jgi:hypothetical protein
MPPNRPLLKQRVWDVLAARRERFSKHPDSMGDFERREETQEDGEADKSVIVLTPSVLKALRHH